MLITWHLTSYRFTLLVSCREVTRSERNAHMKRYFYGERDFAFGQRVQALRTHIGLTQMGSDRK